MHIYGKDKTFTANKGIQMFQIEETNDLIIKGET
jgi:hypothetical protein